MLSIDILIYGQCLGQYYFSFSFFFFCRQNIPLIIIEEGSYEKDVLLYANLGEPQMVGGNCYVQRNEFFILTHIPSTFIYSILDIRVKICRRSLNFIIFHFVRVPYICHTKGKELNFILLQLNTSYDVYNCIACRMRKANH